MAKNRSWFNIVRRFFISESSSTQEKKEKRRKWVFFGRLKARRRVPSITAASPPRQRTALIEAEEEHSKRALDVALATAAAAEAAVAAARAAAEVVLLTHSACKSSKQLAKAAVKEDEAKRRELSAIKIQSSFRGYLARKALRALKGIVKLQAMIRGRNVRRQTMNTLRYLQSIVNIQSQVSAKRIQESCCSDQNKQFANASSDRIIKMDINSQKEWDGSTLTKEEAKALLLSKKEAALKRERVKEYSFNHRNSAETERNKASNGRWRYWLEQWVDTEMRKSKELEDLDTIVTSRLHYTSRKPMMMRNTEETVTKTETPNSTTPTVRRSFHRRQNSLGEETALPKSPTARPTYMASTESAKAKARSMSSPKLRPTSTFDDSYSPSKSRLVFDPESNQQTSPSLKGVAVPVKSSHSTLKDLSIY